MSSDLVRFGVYSPSRLCRTGSPDIGQDPDRALITLPAHFTPVDEPHEAVVRLDTEKPDWIDEGLSVIAQRPRAVMVSAGACLSADGLERLTRAAASTNVLLVADLAYAGDPTWGSIASTAAVDDLSVVDGITWTSGSLRTAAYQLIAAGIMALPAVSSLVPVVTSDSQLVVTTNEPRPVVTWTAIKSQAVPRGQEIDLVAPNVRYHVHWDNDPSTSPTRGYRFSHDGSHRLPLRYEPRSRPTWRQLHAQLVAADHTPIGMTAMSRLASLIEGLGQ